MMFASPHYLWLLPLAVVVPLLGRRVGERRTITAITRVVTLAAIVVALAHPIWLNRVAATTTVTVVDLGPTMPQDVARQAADFIRDVSAGAGTEPRLVCFSNQARVFDSESSLSPKSIEAWRPMLSRPLQADDSEDGGSALAAALRLAAAQVPAGGRGAIEVLTNGLATRGDAEAEAFRLARRGITVSVQPAAVKADAPAVIVRSVVMPPAGRVGQTVSADVVIESRGSDAATLTFSASPGPTASREIELKPGLNRLTCSLPLKQTGLTRIVASAGGSRAETGILVGEAPQVIVVRDPAAGESASLAISSLLGPAAKVTAVSPAVFAQAKWDGAAVVALCDVPFDALAESTQSRLRQAVTEGLGLIVSGGPQAWPKMTDRVGLAPLMPVALPHKAESVEPSTTLVLVIDTSGSMQGEPLNLAKEVARLAISHLRPRDNVGLVEFFGGRRWASPVQPVGDGAAIDRALSRLTPGGSSDLYPAVEEAAFALRNVVTQSKHVLILSDGGVTNSAFASRVRKMAAEGVTTSTVRIGATDDGDLMSSIALWGGGRYYTVADRYAMPDITLKQPKINERSPLVKSPTAITAGDDALTRDTATPWPAVSGYVRLTPRSTADVLLRTTGNDPLLSRWRYGAGWVAALSTPIGTSLAAPLQDDVNFAALFASLVRDIGQPPDGLAVRPTVRPVGVEVDVTSDRRADGSALRIRLLRPDGSSVREVTAEPMSAGRWNVLWPNLPAGLYVCEAKTAGGLRGVGAVCVEPARRWPSLKPNDELIEKVQSFRALARQQSAGLPGSTTWTDLRPAFVVLAVIALLTNVFARRWPADRSLFWKARHA